MARKRKDGCPLDINDDPRIFIDRNEIMKLTKVAKSWEFTCSFCFKKFPSAQAMGGHQNAHRSERLEEKRLFVRDPIGYRKRAYLRAIKSETSSGINRSTGPNPSLNLHAPTKMVKNETANFNVNAPPKILPNPMILPGDLLEINAPANGNNYFFHPTTSKDSLVLNINGENPKMVPFVVMNFLPPKELSLAESIGVRAEDVKGKACIHEYKVGGCGINLDHHKDVDLTLKL